MQTKAKTVERTRRAEAIAKTAMQLVTTMGRIDVREMRGVSCTNGYIHCTNLIQIAIHCTKLSAGRTTKTSIADFFAPRKRPDFVAPQSMKNNNKKKKNQLAQKTNPKKVRQGISEW